MNHINQIPTTSDFTKLRKIDRLYGYLQVMSKWNGTLGEPRFVEKVDFSSSDAANELGISSRTVNRQLIKLKEAGFIKDDGELIHLPINSLFTTVHPETLKYLYQIQVDNVITIYSYLRAMQHFFQERNSVFFFTKRYLITKILGTTAAGHTYDSMNAILDLLDKLGLVELACQKRKAQFGEYKVYAVIKVNDLIEHSEYKTITEVFGEDIYIPTEEEITENLNNLSYLLNDKKD